MRTLELLAPARTADIGIAAIDCGADAVYIAGPAFGARHNASNSLEDIERLCTYAKRFGVKIFATVNTIVYDNELEQAKEIILGLKKAGVDALIVQDTAVALLAKGIIPIHASTQFAIRSPQDAAFAQSLGFERLVLERQLSLKEVKAIRGTVDAELEFFVHGALCVCYSGQCYLSEYLTGRSANRGECAQACRSLYNLADSSGRPLLKNRPVLSLKDLNLSSRLTELADAGICSFKIEGRLKGESYVRNTVRAYSIALDRIVQEHPEKYRRASYGSISGGFAPNLDKTFNRGYTELYLDGQKGDWAGMNSPKSVGEFAGTVTGTAPANGGTSITVKAAPGVVFSNGDGFSYMLKDGTIEGFRAGVADGNRLITDSPVKGLKAGDRIYRNLDAAFEKRMESARCTREIGVDLSVTIGSESIRLEACSRDGRKAAYSIPASGDIAKDKERMLETIKAQLSKKSDIYSFSVISVQCGPEVPFVPVSVLNGARRELAGILSSAEISADNAAETTISKAPAETEISYKQNVANHMAREFYMERGAAEIEDAYELSHRTDAELMRTRYCVRFQMGMCPKKNKGEDNSPLYITNGGKRLRLDFHCYSCEMTVKAASQRPE